MGASPQHQQHGARTCARAVWQRRYTEVVETQRDRGTPRRLSQRLTAVVTVRAGVRIRIGVIASSVNFRIVQNKTLLFAQHASSRDQLLLVEIQVVQVQILGVQVRHIREPTRRRLWRWWRWWRLRRRWWRRPCLVGSRGKLLRLHGKPHQRRRFLHTHTYPHRQHHATSRSATLFHRRTLRSKSWPYIWSSRALATTACDGPYVVSAAATSASRSCWKAS